MYAAMVIVCMKVGVYIMVVTDAARRLAAHASIATAPGRAVFHQFQERHKRLEPAQPAHRQRNTPCWIDSGLSTRAKLRSTNDNGLAKCQIYTTEIGIPMKMHV